MSSYLLKIKSLSQSSTQYQSNILPFIFLLCSKIVDYVFNLLRKNFIFFYPIAKLPIKQISISLLLVSFILGSGNDIQISTAPSSSIIPSEILGQAFRFYPFSLTVIALTLLALVFIKQEGGIKQKFYFLQFELLFLLFFIASMLSVLFSYNMQASFPWMLKLGMGLIVYFIFSRLHLKYKDISFISFVFLSILLFLEILGITQFLKGGLLGLAIENTKINAKGFNYAVDGISYFRVVGTLNHPKALSFFIMMLLPLMTVLAYTEKSLLRNTAFIAMLLGLLTIAFTLSRWEFATASLVILLTLFFLKKYVNKLLLIKNSVRFTILILIIPAFFLFLNPFSSQRFFNVNVDRDYRSLKTRMELFRQSTYMIRSHPWGIGGGAFRFYFANYDYTETELSKKFLASVHSLYFLLATEIGFLGLFIFLIAVLSTICYLLTRLKQLPKKYRIFGVAFLSTLIVFLVHEIFELKALDSKMGMLFWLHLGLGTNLLHFSRTS